MAVEWGSMGSGASAATSCAPRWRYDDIDFVAVNDLTNAATLAHLLKYDSVLGNLRRRRQGHRRRHHRGRRRVQGARGEGPGAAAVEGPGRGRRLRVHRHLHQPRRRGQAHRRPGAKKVIITAPGEGPGRHRRARRQRRQVRSGQAPHHLERVVHDELPGAAGQGDSRAVRHREGLDDDDPLLHERSAPARPAAQGPAAGARRGAVDDPDHHRRGHGGRRSAAGAQGQARRLRDARADAERLGRGPERGPRQEDDRRGGQRRACARPRPAR